MGRSERRAEGRAEAKRKRSPETSTPEPEGETLSAAEGGRPETQTETARRIYRTGGEPKGGSKKERRVSENRVKWREGHQ